jgi:hypothetical protein
MASVTGGIDIGENSPWRIDCSSIADCEKRSLAGCAGSGYTPATRDWILNAFVGLCIGRAWRSTGRSEASAPERATVKKSACNAVATVHWAHISSLALLLTACMSQETPNPVAGSDPAQRLAHWQHCLEASFAEARKKTADPNAAADVAFRTCEPREWQVEVSALREGVPPDAFARRKSEWRRALVQTGRLF